MSNNFWFICQIFIVDSDIWTTLYCVGKHSLVRYGGFTSH